MPIYNAYKYNHEGFVVVALIHDTTRITLAS